MLYINNTILCQSVWFEIDQYKIVWIRIMLYPQYNFVLIKIMLYPIQFCTSHFVCRCTLLQFLYVFSFSVLQSVIATTMPPNVTSTPPFLWPPGSRVAEFVMIASIILWARIVRSVYRSSTKCRPRTSGTPRSVSVCFSATSAMLSVTIATLASLEPRYSSVV